MDRIRLRPRLTYANVMATIAVFIALGGTSYAAIVVTGANVRDGSLTGADVATGSVPGSDLRRNTVTGAQVRDGSLGLADINDVAERAMRGQKGDQGEPGVPGAQGRAGSQGAVGPQGPVGNDGAPGATGATGAQGPKGDTGTAGADGPEGPAGPTGAIGATGLIGPQGPQGPHGIVSGKTTRLYDFTPLTPETLVLDMGLPAGSYLVIAKVSLFLNASAVAQPEDRYINGSCTLNAGVSNEPVGYDKAFFYLADQQWTTVTLIVPAVGAGTASFRCGGAGSPMVLSTRNAVLTAVTLDASTILDV